jgi:DNA-binding transcriptional MerR regulator
MPFPILEAAAQGMVYKIGDLAREFDVTLRALRFYEDRGLVTPERSGTTRLYSAEDRERLRIALFCKRIGLSLGEIGEILDLHEFDEAGGSMDKVRDVYSLQLQSLREKQKETEQTIADLETAIEGL